MSVALMEPDTEWMTEAACRGEDPRRWDEAHPELWPQAITTCWSCPVRGRCEDYSRTVPHASGVWAGVPLHDSAPIDAPPKRAGRRNEHVIADFLATFDEHQGDARLAAKRLDMTWGALSMALRRARSSGRAITFHHLKNGKDTER